VVGGTVGIVVAGGLVVVVGGIVEGGVLMGAGCVVVVVAFGIVVVVGGPLRTGFVVVVVETLVEVGTLVTIVRVVWCRPGRDVVVTVVTGDDVCLLGWEWFGPVDAPTVWTGPWIGVPPT
jgi:hypothetical protein